MEAAPTSDRGADGDDRGGPRDHRRSGRLAPHLIAIALYMAVSLIFWWDVWVTGHPTSTITCNCGDPVEAVWWLAWAPWAITHGHSLFFTNALYAGSGGVNALANTSTLFPSILLAPVTWSFGPIAAFNVAAFMAPVLSAWCMFLLVRTLTAFAPGQVLAGAIWGFSPFIVANVPLGHFSFVIGFFAPLAALVAYKTVREPGPATWRLGGALGLLVVAEFFTSTEMLLIVAVTAVIGVVLSLPFAWRIYRLAWHRILGVAVVAGLVAVPLLIYPAWYAVAGPRHVVGAPWPDNSRGEGVSQIVRQGPSVHAVKLGLKLIGFNGPIGLPVDYLGVALLCALAVSAVVWHRRRLAWVALLTGAVTWSLSLGAKKGPHAWVYPWHWVAHVPLAVDIQPQRFADMTALCVAVLFALSADGWWRLGAGALSARHSRASQTGWQLPATLWRVVVTGCAVLVLLPLATSYTAPFAVQSSASPAWFTAVAPTLPQGSRLLTLPYPDIPHPDAMGWQAEGGFRFDLTGGYVVVPVGASLTSDYVSPQGGATATLTAISLGFVPSAGATASQIDGVRRALADWGVQVVVVTTATPNPTYGATYLTAVLGRLPAHTHGAWVWRSGVVTPTPRTLARAIATCAVQSTSRSPLAGPRCILAVDRGGPAPPAL